MPIAVDITQKPGVLNTTLSDTGSVCVIRCKDPYIDGILTKGYAVL
jgi:hypothetical protein